MSARTTAAVVPGLFMSIPLWPDQRGGMHDRYHAMDAAHAHDVPRCTSKRNACKGYVIDIACLRKYPRWEGALDPIWWTSSERRIRWPEWESDKLGRRARRQFSDEFRAGAVRLVLDEGKTIGAVARELDLTPSALGQWVRHAQADRTKGGPA